MTSDTGEKKVVRNVVYLGGMCPRCEGTGNVTDIDVSQLYDPDKSLNEGAILVPGYKAGGWSVKIFAESGFLDPDKPIRDYSEQELHDFLYREATKVDMGGVNMTFEGLVPKIRSSFLSKDREAMQPHADFVDRAVTVPARTATPASTGGPLLRSWQEHRDVCP